MQTQMEVNGQTIKELEPEVGIRQGVSFSPTLFNLVVDTIIETLPEQLDCTKTDTTFHII